jgi:hypothetical protein
MNLQCISADASKEEGNVLSVIAGKDVQAKIGQV